MAYDEKIREYFEIADDGMQGVIGYYLYVVACQGTSNKNEIIDRLPLNIRITSIWVRNYEPENLAEAMDKLFPFYHSRMAVINLISIFEGALGNIIGRLVEVGKMQDLIKGYKNRLKWAFNMAEQSTMGTGDDLKRIPDICLNIDYARRIRNLWMHNNGIINKKYGEDGIHVQGKEPIIDPVYDEFMATQKQISINLGPEGFEKLSISHIELLHHLHDTIQKIYFGDTGGYSYSELSKQIEWHRALTGQ